jgi:hypothetical protein
VLFVAAVTLAFAVTYILGSLFAWAVTHPRQEQDRENDS